jgi:hypothetical protein
VRASPLNGAAPVCRPSRCTGADCVRTCRITSVQITSTGIVGSTDNGVCTPVLPSTAAIGVCVAVRA